MLFEEPSAPDNSRFSRSSRPDRSKNALWTDEAGVLTTESSPPDGRPDLESAPSGNPLSTSIELHAIRSAALPRHADPSAVDRDRDDRGPFGGSGRRTGQQHHPRGGRGAEHAGLYALVRITRASENPCHELGCIIYGVSLVLLYTASTLYHGCWHAGLKRVLLLLDHIGIYLLIAGTYTPLALIRAARPPGIDAPGPGLGLRPGGKPRQDQPDRPARRGFALVLPRAELDGARHRRQDRRQRLTGRVPLAPGREIFYTMGLPSSSSATAVSIMRSGTCSCWREVFATIGPCSASRGEPAMLFKTSLRIIVNEKEKFSGAVAGVALATFLMILQCGFYLGYDRDITVVLDSIDADLWVIPKNQPLFDGWDAMDDLPYYRMREHPEVAKVARLVWGYAPFRLPAREAGIRSRSSASNSIPASA